MTDPELKAKRRKAVELRLAGVTYEQIAEQLGYASASGAFYAAKEGMEAAFQEPVGEVRQLELDRLDALLLGLWPKARRGDVAAVDRVLKLMVLRARYLGLDTQELPGEKKESPVDDLRARRAA